MWDFLAKADREISGVLDLKGNEDLTAQQYGLRVERAMGLGSILESRRDLKGSCICRTGDPSPFVAY